jgi:hypothetical protein
MIEPAPGQGDQPVREAVEDFGGCTVLAGAQAPHPVVEGVVSGHGRAFPIAAGQMNTARDYRRRG